MCVVRGKFPLHLPIRYNTRKVNPLAESATRSGTRADEECEIRGPVLTAKSDRSCLLFKYSHRPAKYNFVLSADDLVSYRYERRRVLSG